MKNLFYKYFVLSFLLHVGDADELQLYPIICGISLQRITGGIDSELHSWPWMTAIQLNFAQICGGTLIHNQWVLTAAHCIKSTSPSAFKVILGDNNIISGPNMIRKSVSKIIVHESYVSTLKYYDIALLKLDTPVSFSKNVIPACVPFSTDNFEHYNCISAGWGYTYENGIEQSTLREVELAILNATECTKKYSNIRPMEQFCAGIAGLDNGDTCQGDSGGPVLCKKEDSRFYVAGFKSIVSYGRGCRDGGVNTRVDGFRDWIDNQIEKY